MHAPSQPSLLPVSKSDFTSSKVSSVLKRVACRICSVVDGNQCAVQDALHEILVMPDLYNIRHHGTKVFVRSAAYHIYHFLLRYNLMAARDGSVSALIR